MNRILRPFLEQQKNRLIQADAFHLLSKQAEDSFYQHLFHAGSFVLYDTFLQMLSKEASDEHPLAAMTPDLLTNEQRKETMERIHEKYEAGELVLPEPVSSLIQIHLQRRTDAFLEMLERLTVHKDAISRQLLDGRGYSEITALSPGAGDTHRGGRSVCIITTDAGKFVYKPRDMRGERFLYEFVNRYLPDMVCVPKCYTWEDQFGVTEFIEKVRAEGRQEAEAFYRNFGGAAALFKVLGSTDMHVENILCRHTYPVVVDPETILSPGSGTQDPDREDPGMYLAGRDSLFFTTLLPKSGPEEHEFSPLMNVSETGCAPRVDGQYVNVIAYREQFEEGFREAYRRIRERRTEFEKDLKDAAPRIMIRVLLANSQEYFDVQKKLFNANALSTAEKAEKTKQQIIDGMKKFSSEKLVGMVPQVVAQMYEGDIPYFYLKADSTDLLTEGGASAHQFFTCSPLDHALKILGRMGEADENFNVELFRRSLDQYPFKIVKQGGPGQTSDDPGESEQMLPEMDERILSRQDALREAEELFALVCALSIQSPSGTRSWGQISDKGSSFQFCEPWLANGLTGIAVFTAAMQMVSKDPKLQAQAEEVTEGILADLQGLMKVIGGPEYLQSSQLNLGEAAGLGGVLTATALLNRYHPSKAAAGLQESMFLLLPGIDPQKCHMPDRIGGISSLLSALCRFEEYHGQETLIRALADRLVSLKQLSWHGEVLWQPLPDKKRPISGAGHGMAGIAQALDAAAMVLDDSKYLEAAREALHFEQEIYSSQFQTWPDLREYPPVGFMHGYCSGAPGIGIMVQKIKESGKQDPILSGLADQIGKWASKAAEVLPLRERDHLCCGNSAIAEYFLTAGQEEQAGRLLHAMKKRKDCTGSYRYMDHTRHNAVTASLFYGASGIGYEMLRYACPEQAASIF